MRWIDDLIEEQRQIITLFSPLVEKYSLTHPQIAKQANIQIEKANQFIKDVTHNASKLQAPNYLPTRSRGGVNDARRQTATSSADPANLQPQDLGAQARTDSDRGQNLDG